MTTAIDATATRTLYGHFAVFDEWTRISGWEGEFMERNARGAFARSMTERRNRIRALFDHGRDPSIGQKPLGGITELHEDTHGAYYEVPLLDTPYNREFIVPAADAGLLGASYRFSVADNGDVWTLPTRKTAWNPEQLPERVIVNADVFEFGPVVFPQYEGASANLRGIMPSRTERQHYARRAYMSRNGIKAPTPSKPPRAPDRAEQLIVRAHAVRLGRHNARTADQRRASLERERELLVAAASLMRGRTSTTRNCPLETRAFGSVAVR